MAMATITSTTKAVLVHPSVLSVLSLPIPFVAQLTRTAGTQDHLDKCVFVYRFGCNRI